MIAPYRRPRARSTGVIALAIVTTIILAVGMSRGEVLPRGGVASSAVEDDYATARVRLANMLVAVQQVEGFVPQENIAAVVVSLNQALDYLELARIAIDGGDNTQGGNNITAANNIMNGLDAIISSLIAQANTSKQMSVLGIVVGTGVTFLAVVALFWFKRRHSRKQLQSFLAAEIDYAGGDKEGLENEARPGSPDQGEATSEA